MPQSYPAIRQTQMDLKTFRRQKTRALILSNAGLNTSWYCLKRTNGAEAGIIKNPNPLTHIRFQLLGNISYPQSYPTLSQASNPPTKIQCTLTFYHTQSDDIFQSKTTNQYCRTFSSITSISKQICQANPDNFQLP